MARIKILDKDGKVKFIQDDDDSQPVEVEDEKKLETEEDLPEEEKE